MNGVEFSKIHVAGIPHIHISRHGVCKIGQDFVMINWMASYASGIKGKCRIEVRNGATLTIGEKVGMTLTTIICHNKIIIENNVNIGVGVHIYDTDFHSTNWKVRQSFAEDWASKNTGPILIENNVFIGAHCIILKGVTIGEHSIIGAGSVVTKSIPANVIAGGNPCKVIKSLL